MDIASSLLADGSLPGAMLYNVSQVLLIVSMSMRNITLLRLLAVGSGALTLTYRVFIVPDDASAFWQAMFLAVNLVQLSILLSERLRARLSDDEEFFIAHVMPGVHRSQSRRLLKVARPRRFQAGERLIEMDKAVAELVFILAGSAEVRTDGQVVGRCHRGEFVGEMSFISGKPASADVIADTPGRCFTFDREDLSRTLAASHDLRHALEASFNRTLVDKLAKSNGGRSDSGLSPASPSRSV